MNVSKYARYKARYVFVAEKIFPELLRSRLFAEDDQLTNLWMIELLANERPVEVNNPANFRESWRQAQDRLSPISLVLTNKDDNATTLRL